MADQLKPNEIIKNVYLGDRGCKAVFIYSWDELVKIQVTSISRAFNGSWNNYIDENVYDGLLVFEGVKSISFVPSGPIPNDLINDIYVETEVGGLSTVVIEIENCSNEDDVIIYIRIQCLSMRIEDAEGNTLNW